MKLPIPHPGFERNNLHLRVRAFGSPQVMVDDIAITPQKGIYRIQNDEGLDTCLRLKNNLVDPLPSVEINDIRISVGKPLKWYDYLLIGSPLCLFFPAGVLGGVIGILATYVSLRLFRWPNTRKASYGLITLVSFLAITSLLTYWMKTSPEYILDTRTQNEILAYIGDTDVPWHQNNIPYAMLLDRTGRAAWAEGHHREVYDIYRKIIAISYYQGSLQGIFNGLAMLSTLFQNMDNNNEAIKTAKLAYTIGRTINDPFEYGLMEIRLADLLEKTSRSLGLAWRLRAKDSLKGTPFPRDYIRLLKHTAIDLRWLDRKQEAYGTWEEAWGLTKTLGSGIEDKWTKWDIALGYSRALSQDNRCEKAEKILEHILPTFSASEQEGGYYSYILTTMADCNIALEQPALANQQYLQAYTVYELQRSKALGETARARLDNDHIRLIDTYIGMLIKGGQYYAALALLETNKARTLSDIRQDVQQQSVYSDWTALTRKQTQELMDYIHSKEKKVASGENSEDLWKEYQTIQRQHQRQRNLMQVKSQIRTVAVSRTMTEDNLRGLQADLDPTTSIVSIFVSQQNIGVFLLTKHNLHYIPIATRYWDVYRAVQQLRLALSDHHTNFYEPPARLLYDSFIRPLTKYLPPHTKQIVFSPDKQLAFIPFPVLMNGPKFLIEKYATINLPSLRFLNPEKHLQSLKPSEGISCVDPEIDGRRLPFQQETNSQLSNLFQERLTPLVGKNCSPNRLETAIQSIHPNGFLHIGAHGSFYDPDPMLSRIMLSSDEPGGEYAYWDAQAMGSVMLDNLHLATLSSCETGLKSGRYPRDTFGILRALFYGGTHNVIAPLWSVQDQATSRLMQAFYSHYTTKGMLAQALQQAQQSMIHNPKFRHPFYWSGFVLTGGPV